MVTSWANSGARDLHLDLREVIRPGARGVRELLIDALREAVRSGRLSPGTVLPPSRTLAGDLGIARNTVADTYAELVAEGWLASRQGAGTWVVNTAAHQIPVHSRGTRVTPRHNLMPGSPDVAEFPRTAWLAAARRALTNAPNEALRMSDPRGRPELRAALADYLGRVRGVRTSAETIVICAGARHGVELLTRVFARTAPGRPIAVEAYGLYIFRDAIAALGGSTVPIGLDDHGAIIAELDALDVPAALLTPAHHSPHGMPLHPARRTAAVEWAQRSGGVIIDDDYDGEFRYDRQPVGALQSLAPDRVVYLGSASKSLAPALRLGWLALPDDLVEPVIAAAGGEQFYVDAIAQLTMAEFIRGGQYDRHIRRMRIRYRRRRDMLVEALARFDVEVRGLAAGHNLLLTLPDGAESVVLRRAGEAGIACSGLALMRHPAAGPDVPGPDGIIVGFGTPAEHGFGAAVEALAAVLAASGLAR
ncbi:PLP-dependent aminotransferase family protein [Mycolicibacterium sp. S2-37]|uniref:MocR-like pyridoxine biosynthesis transcription factor PdxR n=1 Tax=Mycolicibacterium sp. S2-37 TaxID=2810297 RepID=UPI001A942BE0|nr:PLP-dependent aminotransferase family protein [Mycolicibacterium sp. S2-37]MBO0679764.1 PLP-dependent aminotransferase family protein [Mycolicibacterium sp. S2-37]MBO0681161.1 PLP-dependent aminotransferase family protein [Mycolicibacterium sp. S2-37]